MLRDRDEKMKRSKLLIYLRVSAYDEEYR